MALHFYLDQECTQRISGLTPDYAKNKANEGETIEIISKLYIKSDNEYLTYEDIEVFADGDNKEASLSGEVEVLYSLDDVAYLNTLFIPNQDFINPIKIYRKAIAPNVSESFQRLVKLKIKYASLLRKEVNKVEEGNLEETESNLIVQVLVPKKTDPLFTNESIYTLVGDK